MTDYRKSKPTIRILMNRHRELAKSRQPSERVIGALGVTGFLQKRLHELGDRQVGQLMFDEVWEVLPLASPAMSITMEATHRLFRSPGGASTGETRLNDPHTTLQRCPRCGEPMMRYFGIGEPDYQRCVAVKCGCKVYLTNTQEGQL